MRYSVLQYLEERFDSVLHMLGEKCDSVPHRLGERGNTVFYTGLRRDAIQFPTQAWKEMQ